MARVEVKAFESPADELRVMEVGWTEDGEAMFHDICWKAVIDSYKTDNPFALIPREKEMIKEAWKTAEYFDSADKIAHEAKRIANMLKMAKYAIAFTGRRSHSFAVCSVTVLTLCLLLFLFELADVKMSFLKMCWSPQKRRARQYEIDSTRIQD